MGVDDEDAVFAIAIRKKLTEEMYLVWAGTNHPELNEMIAQYLNRDLWPFTLKSLNIQSIGPRGLIFALPKTDFEDDSIRKRLTEVLGDYAKQAAEHHGYDLKILEENPTFAVLGDLLPLILMEGAMVRRSPGLYGGFSGEEEEGM